MKLSKEVNWAAVDWGTTHLRAYGMSATHQVITEATSDKGMGVLSADGFEPALLSLIKDWLPEKGLLPVLACGMVGARQGWKEAPYQNTPCSPRKVQDLTIVPTAESRIQVRILPGISQDKPADVMRGEETQLSGLLSSQELDSTQVCLPGTHSKWVTIENGKVIKFSTFMTGEVFELLSKHSILRHQSDSKEWDESAFISGVQASLDDPDKLLNQCFTIRARGLLEDLDASKSYSRLSGLLIGAEIAGAKEYWQDSKVSLIGDVKLTALYAQALSLTLIESKIFDPKELTLMGLIDVYKKQVKSGGVSFE